MVSNVSVAALPLSLQEMADTLGVALVLKLIAAYGGTEISFPKNPDENHPILLALGNEDGKALCDYLVGQLIYVPHMRPRKSARPDVLALQGEGKERREIARLLGISQRHVRRVANKPEAPNQFKLFED
ncbi:helix-turn-helix domain-containing protein [Rhizobium ruizarguesonis]